MKINAYVKNRGSSVTSKLLPSSPPLQRGRGLANHPLSCQPHRSVWQPRKGEKMREKEEKWENWSPNFIQSKKRLPQQCVQMAYIALQTK